MKRSKVILLALLFSAFSLSGSLAATIELVDWGFNVNGELYTPGDSLPGYYDVSGFNFSTGLGEISIDWDPGIGDHSFIAFFDHDIDRSINGYTNESGSVLGAPNAGQSWEIDEPGYFSGDIYDNFEDGTLDNSNAVPVGSEDDVSMAIGWDFSLAADEFALITLALGQELPDGFSTWHSDFESSTSIFFSSTLEKTVIPVPSTIALFGSGILSLLYFRRRIRK